MEVIDTLWFTEMGSFIPIGVVLAYNDESRSLEVYIGTGYGLSESVDAQKIADTGAKFTSTIPILMEWAEKIMDQIREKK